MRPGRAGAHRPLAPAPTARPARPDGHPHRPAPPEPLRPGAARRGRPAPPPAPPAGPFGRNQPLWGGRSHSPDEPLHPEPARGQPQQLLTRTRIKPVPFLNLLAAAWIQFMVHDWFSHGTGDRQRRPESRSPRDDPLAPEQPATMLVPKTAPIRAAQPARRRAADLPNEITHWWDGSQLYGSDAATAAPPAQPRAAASCALDATACCRSSARRLRGHRLQRQLVARPRAHAHAVRARAQRDLRPCSPRTTRDWDDEQPLRQGAPDQRGA